MKVFIYAARRTLDMRINFVNDQKHRLGIGINLAIYLQCITLRPVCCKLNICRNGLSMLFLLVLCVHF